MNRQFMKRGGCTSNRLAKCKNKKLFAKQDLKILGPKKILSSVVLFVQH
jgi:hypothetical protein